jgi:ribonuclease P protein component
VRVGRVRSRNRFAALAATDRRARRGAVRVSAVFDEAVGLPCVAYAVGRHVGTAVIRNRIRRRLRAAVAELDLAPGAYLVVVDPSAARRSYAQLRADLAGALHALGAVAAPA